MKILKPQTLAIPTLWIGLLFSWTMWSCQSKSVSLRINTDVEEATVRIDGEVVGTAPMDIFVTPGEHTVEVIHPENSEAVWSKTLSLAPETSKVLTAKLKPALRQIQKKEEEAKKLAKKKEEEAKRLAGARKGYPKIKNSLADNMVYVQGGSFEMGCTDEQYNCYSDEKPVHRVTVSDFTISKYEVTQGQWRAIMGNNPSNFSGCAQCPVENVSWDDVQEFLKVLNRVSGKEYRLPTEAEWEYAARGGQKSRGYKYAGSDNIDEVAWYDGNRTHPVGQKAPNELGLYDMSGNVWEWCSDGYGDYSSNSQTNPKGASSGTSRVCRGGSWNYDAEYCRVSTSQ